MSVYKRGNTYWFAFVFDGRRVQRSTKQGNRKAAIDIESAYRTALAKGEVGIAPKRKERRMVGELLDALKGTYEQDGKLSPQNKSLLSRAEQDFGSKMAGELTPEDVEKYIQRRKNEGAKNSSINRVTEVIRRAYKLAGVGAPRMTHLSEKDNVRQGFFNEAELTEIISHLPEDLRDFTRWCTATGMRKGEASGLTWNMIAGDELQIPGNICKYRKGRILPLTGELGEIIERRRAALAEKNDGTLQMPQFIFHRDGAAVAELRKSWQTAAIAAGLGIMICKKCGQEGREKYCRKCKRTRKYQGRIFHDLRRTASRNMLRAGVPQVVAMKITGHKTDAMFRRYAIVTTDDMREAAKKTEEYRKSQREKVVAIAAK